MILEMEATFGKDLTVWQPIWSLSAAFEGHWSWENKDAVVGQKKKRSFWEEIQELFWEGWMQPNAAQFFKKSVVHNACDLKDV